ncbi:tetratricopeptide repeat protein [Candidatus Roizmanbacteria bacterium]|nr:tetratricopeptide repeat protein [Candidatus Roizmanbacteria bacterium]
MTKKIHHPKKQSFFYWPLFVFAFVFTIANIVSSVNISPLYFEVLREDKKITADFLKKTDDLPQFDNLFKMNSEIFGSSLKEKVFSDSLQRQSDIKRLKELLAKNPKSRDLLYGLSILYQAEGNQKTAEEYLSRAREIDPRLVYQFK